MRLGVAKCGIPCLGHCYLGLWPRFWNNRGWSIFSILFELGIPNLVCGCIFGWQSVMYQFCDHDLISRIILLGAYLIYYLREESQICCMDTSLEADVSHTILGHCNLDL